MATTSLRRVWPSKDGHTFPASSWEAVSSSFPWTLTCFHDFFDEQKAWEEVTSLSQATCSSPGVRPEPGVPGRSWVPSAQSCLITGASRAAPKIPGMAGCGET